jgi:acyl carrier protein
VIARQDLETAIKRVMADVLDLDVDGIRDDTSSGNTPKWDSANHIQLMLALEEEFSISLEVAELESMLSYAEIVKTVRAKR